MSPGLAPNELGRGCGARRVGKLYLIGEGLAHVCPSLPLTLAPCDCCGFIPKQYRDYMTVPKSYFAELKKKNPTGQMCHPECPVCYPSQNDLKAYGLMWVGAKFYTPEDFVKEADKVGVSKAIKQIPAGVTLGKTWIMLAHPQGFRDISDDDFAHAWGDWEREGRQGPEPLPPSWPGVFYAFRPTRVETLLYQSDATPEKVAELEARGITVVVVPDGYDDHKAQKRRGGKGANRL